MSGLPDLRMALAAFAARPRVLFGVDFDGTLAPFVTDPMTARSASGGLEALRAAGGLPGVTAAVVSGRDLDALRLLTGLDPSGPVVLLGSHGAQSSLGDDAGGGAALLDAAGRQLLGELTAELADIVARHPGVRVEHKPAAVALHTRGVEQPTAAMATAAALEVATRHTGAHVMPGKDVVELTILEPGKGAALRALAAARRVDATAYVGDDVTDERAFEVLDPASGDLTVKVGDGPTVAGHRVGTVEEVVSLLELFVALRTGS